MIPTKRSIPANYPLTLLFDGACPVCMLEMDNLKARNQDGLLAFVDISGPLFDPAPFGASLAAMNGLIHATRPDGSLVIGTEVFRLAYGAVGLGRWAAPTGWPVLKPVIDVAYAFFARHRYPFSRAFMPVLERLRRWRTEQRAVNAEEAARTCHHRACEAAGNTVTPGTHQPTRSSS